MNFCCCAGDTSDSTRLTASFLLQWTFVKLLGGAYLVYIGVRHLFFESKETEEEKIVLDEQGHPKLVEQSGAEL